MKPIPSALGAFASAIKSGEPWTPSCEALLRMAQEEYEKLVKALEHYVDMEALKYPEDWDYPGMGGPPKFEDLEVEDIGDVAREALGI